MIYCQKTIFQLALISDYRLRMGGPVRRQFEKKLA